MLSSPALAQDTERLTVTAAVQVTENPAPVRAHSSPRVARHPKTGELVLVEADVRGELACKVHLSVDEGRSWFRGGELMPKDEPVCVPGAEYGALAVPAFGADGVLYVAFVAGPELGQGRDNTPRSVYLARSTNSGRTFTNTRVFEAPQGNPDRGLNKGPTLAVDPDNSDRVYVGWRQGVFRNAKEKLKSVVAASADGGTTFGPPVDLTDERGGDYPLLAVGAEGVVHAVYWTRQFPPGNNPNGNAGPVRPVRYSRSTDNGTTFSPAKDIDPGNQQAPRPGSLAADPDSGAVYLAWYAHEEPQNAAENFVGDYEVFFRRSADGGETWSERTVLNDDEGAARPANQYHPGLSVASGGRIDVAWYDGRHSPVEPPAPGDDEAGFQDVYYTSSSDGGASFTPNRRISDRSIDRSIGVYSNNIDSNTNVGITSGKDVVHIAWQDSRNADRERQPEDVYTAAVVLGDPAAAASSTPAWPVLGAGVLLGLGLGVVGAWLFSRRVRAPARTAVPSSQGAPATS